jgi:hypothetical protein
MLRIRCQCWGAGKPRKRFQVFGNTSPGLIWHGLEIESKHAHRHQECPMKDA